MNPNTLKSIGAVIGGLIFIMVTHTATDAVFESAGVIPKGHLNVGTGLILFVVLYRVLWSLLGCYMTARIAPSAPMKYALILGAIGTVLSIAGAIVTMNMDLAPAWYGWMLAVTALPVAWVGGRLALRSTRNAAQHAS
jgi:hypothetical protein